MVSRSQKHSSNQLISPLLHLRPTHATSFFQSPVICRILQRQQTICYFRSYMMDRSLLILIFPGNYLNKCLDFSILGVSGLFTNRTKINDGSCLIALVDQLRRSVEADERDRHQCCFWNQCRYGSTKICVYYVPTCSIRHTNPTLIP